MNMNAETSPVIFGEVLFDVFPDGSRVLGGAPFNVAWHCQAFGLNPLFISRVGDDALGKEIELAMREWGMNTAGLQLDNKHQTGVVKVSISDDEPSYDIVENSAWDFINAQNMPEIGDHSLLYHGSLSMRTDVSNNCLSFLKKQFSESIFVDVNLRPPWWNFQKIGNILHEARWIKLNVDELDIVVPVGKNISEKVQTLMSESDFEFVIVTRGSEGALAFNDSAIYSVEPESGIELVDTVGAGDAFTSVLLLGLHKGWTLNKIITHAQEFASEIVGLHGATIQDRNFYTPFIRNWNL